MHSPALPLTRDVVLIGGGHTHALLLRRWGMSPLPGARLTLISPAPSAPYTGMLPGHIAGHYSRDALEIDLVRLTRHAGARLILARAEQIDRAGRRVHVSGRPPVAYDLVSVDIGVTSALPEVAGYSEHAASAKPMDRYAADWARFLDELAAGRAKPHVVVIGAGVAGVELALAMANRLRREGHAGASVTVLESGEAILPNVGAAARTRLMRHMKRLGIVARTGARATRIEARAVLLDGGGSLPADFTLVAAGPRPLSWLAETGLHLTDGYITVDATLRSVNDPRIFAVGDCAHMATSPRAKAGVYAVRQAPVLYRNLRAALGVGCFRRYRAQRDYLKLVSTGGRGAVADKWGLAAEGGWLWRLKDRIDARFMHRLAHVPPMPPPAPPAKVAEGVREEIADGKPLCAGCGAKMGAAALHAALAGLPAPERDDLLAGPGDDAAVLRHGEGTQVITTDHLRALTDDPWLMARVTAVHALGDVWAMGAAPQVALASVTLPRMSAALQSRTLSEIMAAAFEMFAAEGAAVAGGHTALGAEFTLGFTVTGLAGARVIGKGGAQPGDVLILTKPIGTGTILAAEMGRVARGRDVAAAWESMAQPQGAAARLLAAEARAMTDVTGFGLAGHLLEMMDASGTAARLWLVQVPLLPGALALAGEGHASSLAPANRAAIAGRVSLPGEPRGALLIDPQTAGGLLAAVPAKASAALIDALRAEGFDATAAIGEVVEGPPRIVIEDG
jgi:selenide, water dikinase